MLEEHHNQHQRRQVLRSVPLLRACGFKDLELDVVASLFRYQIFSHGDAMATAGQVGHLLARPAIETRLETLLFFVIPARSLESKLYLFASSFYSSSSSTIMIRRRAPCSSSSTARR